MRKTHTEIHLRNEPKHGHKEYKYLYQQKLKAAGYDYAAVQKKVNELL